MIEVFEPALNLLQYKFCSLVSRLDSRKKRHLNFNQKYASKVSEKSEKYGDARYLRGVALYAQGKKRKAEKELEKLQKWNLFNSYKIVINEQTRNK